MTPEEFGRLEKYAEERMDDQFEYCEVIHVADQLKSPDIKGLVEWFESPDCFLSEPPSFFIALDRWSLQVADDANSDDDAVDFWAECIIGYDRAGEYVLRDENEYCYATWTAGIKHDRFSFEDGLGVCMRIDQDKCEILGFHGSEVLYWKWMRSFAEKTPRGMGDEAFESPSGRAYWPSVEWDK